MIFQEPVVEFVKLDRVVVTEVSPGQEMHACSGSSFQPDEGACSIDPSYF